MWNRKGVTAAVLSIIGVAGAGLAQATDGYFSHGYGMKAKGRGGASTAMTTDTFGGANNPATMVWVGDRLDIGMDWFRPDREASRSGSAAGVNGSASGNDTKDFLIPEFGYNKLIRPDLSLGVSVYGNGGMNTDYRAGAISCAGIGGLASANLLCGPGSLGVDLSQLIIAPTAAMKINERHSFGVSPLIAYQRFKADGLGGFAQISSDPANLTGRGYDNAWGWGVRVGWLGKLSDTVSLGAA